MSDIQKLDKEYIASTYGRFDLVIKSGKGSLLYDESGKEYIDLGSGIAVNVFGVCDDVWKKAVIEQLDNVSHTSNLYYSIPQTLLAQKLCEKTGMKKVFFSNSGAEANECAIKVARKYASDKYGAERNVIVTLKNSFHGRTIATLAATGQDVFHKNFGPFPEGFVYADPKDPETLKSFVNKGNVCGIMMEIVQGEAGVLPLDAEFVKLAGKLCEQNDICLIIDEVQTGNGRTGTLYAYEQFGLKPDIVSTAKGLAGGLPFGACMMGEKVKDVLGKGDHGSTFGGNPVCCAGALSVLERIDDKILEGVKERSSYIKETLSEVPEVESVTGLGLMLGISLKKNNAADVVKLAIKKGCVPLLAKEKVRLLPALNIPMEQLKKAMDILISAIKES